MSSNGYFMSPMEWVFLSFIVLRITSYITWPIWTLYLPIVAWITGVTLIHIKRRRMAGRALEELDDHLSKLLGHCDDNLNHEHDDEARQAMAAPWWAGEVH